MNVGIQFDWRDVGEVRLDIAGRPEFPTLSTKPGVYAFRFASQEGTITVYVGEAENLQRRAAHYRNPGPSQATNIRLNDRMRSHLAGSGRITMHLITEARVEVDGDVQACDLSSTFVRRFLENAALVATAQSGQKIENL